MLASHPASVPRSIFAVCPHPLAVVGHDGRIKAVNTSWTARFSGTTGSVWIDLIHPDDRDLAASATPDHECRLRLRLSTPRAGWAPWQVALAPVAEEDGILVSALAAEGPGAESVGALDGRNLAIALSHDVAQHARLAGSYATLVSRQPLDATSAAQVAVVIEQTARLQQVLMRLVRWLRLADQPMEHRPCDLAAVWRQAVVGLPVDIVTGPLPVIDGDAEQLTEMFRELALNAVRYHGGTAPRLTLHASRAATGWDLDLADDGPGIAAEYRERMLLPLHRRHTWEEVPGQGMGLALAARIAVRHGGGIRLDGGANGGCTVHIHLAG